MKQYDIRLAKVPQPPKDCTGEPVMLTDATIQERLDKVLRGMKSRGLSSWWCTVTPNTAVISST